MEATSNWKTWAAAEFQRCRDPDLPDHEGAVRHAAETDDRLRAEPSSAGRDGVDRAGLQHPVPSPADADRKHLKRRAFRFGVTLAEIVGNRPAFSIES